MAKGISKSKGERLVQVSTSIPQATYDEVSAIAEELEKSQAVIISLLLQSSLEHPTTKIALKLAGPIHRMKKRYKRMVEAHQRYQEQVGVMEQGGLFE